MANLNYFSSKELASDLIAYVSIILSNDGLEETPTTCQESELDKVLQKMYQDDDFPGILAQVIQHASEIIGKSSDNDIEGCFNIAQALLLSLPSSTDGKLLEELVHVILKDVDTKQVLRLSIVVNLFNKLGDVYGKLKYHIFTKIVDYAAVTNNSKLVFSYMKDFDKLFEGQTLSVQETRELFLKLSNIFSKCGNGDESQNLLFKYLATFQDSSKEELVAIKDIAVRVASSAIKSPLYNFTSTKSLLDFAAITQLKDDPKYSQLYALITIFCHDKLPSYMKFYESNPAVFQTYGIDHNECVANMRLLSICSLAAENERVSYDKIATALQVQVGEVEEWIVKAITAKLVEAQIDQIEQVVLVSWSAHRNFGTNEWKMLQKKLTTWKSNIRSLLTTIQNSREVQP